MCVLCVFGTQVEDDSGSSDDEDVGVPPPNAFSIIAAALGWSSSAHAVSIGHDVSIGSGHGHVAGVRLVLECKM